ncbi:MAG: FemAB family system-associated protein [Caulobacteraceae bacterium]|nr:FemAB family system-associated protein [Caulobacteraceae bacterium]
MTYPPDLEWDAFVRAHAAGSFFHLSAWKEIMETVFGHRVFNLSVRRDGALVAVLPLVELRSRLFGHALIGNAFCAGGGPLATDQPALRQVIAEAEALGRELEVDYIELRDTPEAGADWIAQGELYANFDRPVAADEEACLREIPKRQRAVIRKALDRGLAITLDRTADDFYPLYARTMRDHGTPALPRRYFEHLLKTFAGDCEVLTVRQDGRPIGSVVSYFYKGRVMPYYTGSHPDARKVGSNDALYWALMRRAVSRQHLIFDFGRSKVGTGPYAFKRNWGFEPRPIVHQYRLLKATALPNLNPTNAKYAHLIQLWRQLPLPIATGISPLLSRNLG